MDTVMSISFFREKYQWLTKFILVAIVVSFIFSFGYFGVSSLQSGVPTGTAAKVNGEKIPLIQFYNFRENMYRQFRLGRDEITPDTKQFINVSTLQQLVEIKLMAQKARELGFYISDEELSRTIINDPSFQIDGDFIGPESYRNIIRRNLNIDVGEFEEMYREDLLVRKFRELINSSIKINDEELYNIYKVENETVSLYYAEFKTEDFTNSTSVSSEEIKDHYNKNKKDYLTPEERKIKFTKISRNDFINQIRIGDDEVRSYYESYGDEFKGNDGKLKDIEEVKSEIINKLKARMADKRYKDFALFISGKENLEPVDKITEENSLKKPSQSQFFSLNQSTEGFSPDIRERVFSLEAGETSYVNSEKNLWIFQLTDIRPQKQRTFEESKADIASALSRTKGSKAAEAAAQKMLGQISKSSKSFKDAAKKLGAKVNETEPFSRTNPPRDLDLEDLKFDAFFLTSSDPNGQKVYQKENSYFVISLKKKFDIDLKEFEDKKPEIRSTQLAQRENELLSEWLVRLRENAEIIPNPSILN